MDMRPAARILILLAIIASGALCQSTLDFNGAQWIWHPSEGIAAAWFMKDLVFDRPIERIDVLITADDSYELQAYNRIIGSGADWQKPGRYEIPTPPAPDSTTIVIRAANTGGAAGVICKLVIHFKDGSESLTVSDDSWLCTEHAFTSGEWGRAKSLGKYPCQPWGPVVKESWEALRGRLIERREKMVEAVKADPPKPVFSEYKGQYLHPEYAHLYRSFIKLNRKTGLLEYEGKVIRPFFTIYSQPKEDGGWILNIPDFDYDLVEKDFARMKKAGINVQPRFWNWSELLTPDGEWKECAKQPKGHGLPYFKYVYQVYDYFLDRAQAHGLYVDIEPSYYWGLHPEVVPPEYRGKILLYGELWDATNEAYAKILNYFSKRTVIVAVMVGEEDLVFDHCLDEPQMLQQFQRSLSRKYGSVSNLRRTWGYGYDYSSRALWRKETVNGRVVLQPRYPFVKDQFKWLNWGEVTLPILDYCRPVDNPGAMLTDMPTYQQNLLKDPAWIDFLEMKEQMLISRLGSLASTFRDADSNHILYYSNPSDFNPPWHFYECFDRARLRFDLIGVGQHDKDFEPSEVPQWASCREYVQNVASYGPYIGATGAYPKGFACGEGMGGKTREGLATYYPWWLTDIIGGGGALFQSYDWNLIAGRTFDKPAEYDEATLNRLGDFLAAIQDAPFNRPDAKVLILRNKAAALGMSAGYDFGNARYLASVLYQLHIPFDILPDSDIVAGDFEAAKVNINRYNFIFVPAQNQLLSSRTWQILQDWIADPRFAGQRGLCLGLYQDQDSYFNPTKATAIHPAFQRLTGTSGFTRRMKESGIVKLRYARFFGSSARGDELSLEFPDGAEIGCFDSLPAGVDKVLELGEDGPAIIARNIVNGNLVYTCGFYLGMAYNAMWGMEKEQSPYNTLTPLYSAILTTAGIEPPVIAADNLGIYVAADTSTILVKERFGKATDVTLDFPANRGIPLRDKGFPGAVFYGATTVWNADGSIRLKDFSIQPYGVQVLHKMGSFGVSGGKDVSWACKPLPDGGLDCTISGKGKITATFGLKPKMIYSAWENNKLSMVFTAGSDGKHQMPFTLSAKPLHLSVKPSKR